MSAVVRVAPRVLMVLTLAGIIAGCGNGTSVNPPTTTTGAGPDCRGALQGRTYAVCGRLATAPNPGSNGTRSVLGSADSGASGQGGTYVIEGGTFHAGR